LPANSDTTLENWLLNTRYPEWRKLELLKVRDEMSDILTIGKQGYKYAKVKSFVKDEIYPEYKHARVINSRCDAFKISVGPIFKLIEEELYKLHYFVKKVPVNERASYIESILKKNYKHYVCTDHSQFEAHFTLLMMEICEFELYDYMTQNLPQHSWFMKLCREFIGGKNYCTMADVMYEILATRMSGEMCTSLGNGFTNLMAMLFVCHQLGIDTDGVVEGDDGLFGLDECPTSDDFKKAGFTIKMKIVRSYNVASFCGLLFSEELQFITDPIKVLLNFCWIRGRYARSKEKKLRQLLRGKVLCVLFQYPACPLITQFAFQLNDLLLDYEPCYDFLDPYEAEKFLPHRKRMIKVKIEEIHVSTRHLMEEVFGILVSHQILIEESFKNIRLDKQTELGLLDLYVPQLYLDHYDQYCSALDQYAHFGPMMAKENECKH
jgi:hypothetical protein